jgi:hypothetical protein
MNLFSIRKGRGRVRFHGAGLNIWGSYEILFIKKPTLLQMQEKQTNRKIYTASKNYILLW